jgi:hypothetical protein
MLCKVVDLVNENYYHSINIARNAGMNRTDATYDPELPDANAVLASLCCVASRYATSPSPELAQLAANLSRKLTAPEYAESKLVVEVAQHLLRHWEGVAVGHNKLLTPVYESGVLH